MQIENIPSKLKLFPQWITWKYELAENGKQTKVPYNSITHNRCDYTNPVHFTTFDNAVRALQTGLFSGIGFCLTKNDPFTFIDLDNKEYTEAEWQHQKSIFENIVSYAELSPSGVGLHIIVEGELPKAIKKHNIEMYSNDRFMTVTGDVYRNIPIQNCQIKLNEYYTWHIQNTKNKETAIYVDDEKETKSDEQIINIASNAHNKELFIQLYYFGDWEACEYPSQSEADFALINIIAFYSRNREQTRRIFLQSKLGQRPKSRADYRLKRMLDRCLDNQQPLANIDTIRQDLEQLVKSQRENTTTIDPYDIFKIPPGLVGDIAKFIYEKSPRPVPEVSLCAALGLMAGITGRAYNISGAGTNIYIALIAKTGIGKDVISSGTNMLINEVSRRVPVAKDIIGPDTISSSQALVKHLATCKSMFCVLGEFGLMTQQLTDIRASENKVNLRRTLLQLYTKSGHNEALSQIIYSDKDKNTPLLQSPSLTIVGETTPITFYTALRTNSISEGFLPRFTIIEYDGIRVPLNENHLNVRPSNELIERLSSLTAYCAMLNNENQCINVGINELSAPIYRAFDQFCDAEVNNSNNELGRNLWSRGHLKSLKIGALIAIGVNPHSPMITDDIAKWSVQLITYEINNILKRVNDGYEEESYQGTEAQQINHMKEKIKEYLEQGYRSAYTYDSSINKKLYDDKIISYRYLYKRCYKKHCFIKDRMGASYAIKRALQILMDSEYLVELNKFDLATNNRKAKYYYVMPTILESDEVNENEIFDENNVINVNFNRNKQGVCN